MIPFYLKIITILIISIKWSGYLEKSISHLFEETLLPMLKPPESSVSGLRIIIECIRVKGLNLILVLRHLSRYNIIEEVFYAVYQDR